MRQVIVQVTRRLLGGLAVLFGSSIVVFFVVASAAAPLATLEQQSPPPPPAVLRLESIRLGLNQPLGERYINWLSGLVIHGTFGPSVVAGQDIGSEISGRIFVSARLVIASIIVSAIVALVAGTLMAVYQDRYADRVLLAVSFIVLAVPSFVLAILLEQVGVQLDNATNSQIVGTVGAQSIPAPTGFWDSSVDIAGHLALPTIVLSAFLVASWSRYHRAAVAGGLATDRVQFAIARGLGRARVIWSYAVRPELAPIVTVIALDIPLLISGSVIVESIFQWQGMGLFLLQSIEQQDTNAVLGWLIIASIAVVAGNAIADMIYLVIDPRIRARAAH